MPASSKMFLSAHSFRRIIVIDLVILPFDEASDRGRSIQVEKTIPLSQVKESRTVDISVPNPAMLNVHSSASSTWNLM